MGGEDLIVAGSHGFDIWGPTEGTLEHEAAVGFEELIERVTEHVREEAGFAGRTQEGIGRATADADGRPAGHNAVGADTPVMALNFVGLGGPGP